MSSRFAKILESGDTVQEAAKQYKIAVMQDLVVSIRRAEIQEHLDDVKDEELFEQFFPISKPATPVVKPALPFQ